MDHKQNEYKAMADGSTRRLVARIRHLQRKNLLLYGVTIIQGLMAIGYIYSYIKR